MFRRRRDQVDAYGPIIERLSEQDRWVMGDSAQEIWNSSISQLSDGMVKMIEVANHPPPGGPQQADMEFIAERLLNAMWGLEELTEKGQGHGGGDTGLLAKSVGEILEGLRNGEPARVNAGFDATQAELSKVLPSE